MQNNRQKSHFHILHNHVGAFGRGIPAGFRRVLRHHLAQIERERGEGVKSRPAEQTQSGFLGCEDLS